MYKNLSEFMKENEKKMDGFGVIPVLIVMLMLLAALIMTLFSDGGSGNMKIIGFIFFLLVATFLTMTPTETIINAIVSFKAYLKHNFSRPMKEKKITFSIETLIEITLKNPIYYASIVTISLVFIIIFTMINAVRIIHLQDVDMLHELLNMYIKIPLGVASVLLTLTIVGYYILSVFQLQQKIRYREKNYDTFKNVLLKIKNIWFGIFRKENLLISFVFFPMIVGSIMLLIEQLGGTVYWINLAHTAPFVFVFTVFKRWKKNPKINISEEANQENILAEEKQEENQLPKITENVFEIKDIIEEINSYMKKVEPYISHINIEDIHVLQRITTEEAKEMIHHYKQLDVKEKEKVKAELQKRMKQLKEKVKEIVSSYHLNEFKKATNIVDKRYSTEESM